MSSKIPKIISIDGNIGSGKTTLLNYLEEYLPSVGSLNNTKKFVFLREPVDEWEKICDSSGTTILQKFYADQIKYAFSFQMMAYISRLALLKETITQLEDPENTIIITERSLFTDKCVFAKMLYDSGRIEEVDFKIYMMWFNTFVKDYPINSIIYIDAKPEICIERIAKRMRTGEEIIPIEYLENCDEYHKKMIAEGFFEKCLVLDGNMDINEEEGLKEKWVRLVVSII
jgi:thymidylate kinase